MPGVTIKVRSHAATRGATLAKRIISEVEVGLLIRAARSRRDRVLIEVAYAGGLRVSELVGLTWSDVLPRDERVQLSVTGKGRKVRQVLLPEIVSRSLMSLRGDAGANDAVFASRKGGSRLTERAVNGMVKRTAVRAGINPGVSPALAAPCPRLPRHRPRRLACRRCRPRSGTATSRTTSGYLHARPSSSSGLVLDPGVFLR